VATRGSLSSRSSGLSTADSATTRKTSLTAKRASVIEMNTKSPPNGKNFLTIEQALV